MKSISSRVPPDVKRVLRPPVRLLRKLLNIRTFVDSINSYSQCGEDRILAFLCGVSGIAKPRFLDIGANDPVKLSNTYLFYRYGCTGVCVEPNPVLWEKLKRKRPKDVCLNIGIGSEGNQTLPFYRFAPEADGLSTFSKTEAEESEKFFNFSVAQIDMISTQSINSVIKEHFSTAPTILSIDVEGLDLEILQSLDFRNYAPLIICVETNMHVDGSSLKNETLIEFLKASGYRIFADTYINTIFIRSENFPSV